MKVYIYFNQRDQTYVCHEMAKYWKNKGCYQEFAGCVVAKGGAHFEFLKKQSDLRYQAIDVVDEWEIDALSIQVSGRDIESWEKRLGLPLWNLVVADKQIGHSFIKGGNFVRTDLSRQADLLNIQRLVIYTLNQFLNRFVEYNPDLIVLSNNPASMNSLAMVKVAELLGIPYFIPHPSYVRDRMFIAENNPFMSSNAVNECFFSLPEDYEIKLDREHQEFMTRLASLDAKKPPWLDLLLAGKKKSSEENLLSFWWSIAKELIHATLEELRRKRHPADSLRAKLPFSNFVVWFQQKRAYRKGAASISVVEPQPGEKYVVVPLSVTPEASTMVFAPNFVNPFQLIEEIVRSVPLNFRIYVTEHPAMLGRRPKGFYEELEQFPNVLVRGPLSSNDGLVANAVSVVLVSGTTGLEALSKGVHTVLLGKAFYSELGLAESILSIRDLREVLLLQYEEIMAVSHRQKRRRGVERLLFALQENSFVASSNLFWGLLRDPSKMTPRLKQEIINVAMAIESSFDRMMTEETPIAIRPTGRL